MPIANCIVSEDCYRSINDPEDLITLWSEESRQSPKHMTVNFVQRLSQYGNEYEVMASLLLPSVWSRRDIELLQVGLANALAKFFDIPLASVHVVTHIVESGLVVENGELVQW